MNVVGYILTIYFSNDFNSVIPFLQSEVKYSDTKKKLLLLFFAFLKINKQTYVNIFIYHCTYIDLENHHIKVLKCFIDDQFKLMLFQCLKQYNNV